MIRFDNRKLLITGAVTLKELIGALEALGPTAESVYIDVYGFSEGGSCEISPETIEWAIGHHENHQFNVSEKYITDNVVSLNEARKRFK